MNTPTKFNGPKLDAAIMASHLTMHNWDAIEKMRKRNCILDNIAIILAIGLMVYTCVR